MQRHQRDEHQVGKGDARQRDSEVELARIGAKARREQVYEERREDERQDQQKNLRGEQQGEDAAGKFSCFRRALGLEHARVGGHEGRVERALAENGAKVIGQAEGDDERVGHEPSAERRRKHDVARETGDARQQREAADGKQVADHSASFGCAALRGARSRASTDRCSETIYNGRPFTSAKMRPTYSPRMPSDMSWMPDRKLIDTISEA